MNYKNLNSINSACDTQGKWCLSCKMLSTMQQATVKFSNGKSYKYISRFPVKEGDIAIVGNAFAMRYSNIYPLGTTGMIGVVTEALPKVEIKRGHAAELDFVFSKTPDKKMITQCEKYLGIEDYAVALQFSKDLETVRPVTHFIRRLLAAVSILANKDLAKADSVNMAMSCIQEKPVLDVDRVAKLDCGLPEYVGVNFAQTCFRSDYSEYWALLKHNDEEDFDEEDFEEEDFEEEDFEEEDFEEEDFEVEPDLSSMSEHDFFYKVLSDPKMAELIARDSFFGAYAAMARGGFLNLMQSFIDAKPPYGDYAALDFDFEGIEAFKEIEEFIHSGGDK